MARMVLGVASLLLGMPVVYSATSSITSSSLGLQFDLRRSILHLRPLLSKV
jgi:hypothetical protein